MNKGVIVFVFVAIFVSAILFARFTGRAVTSLDTCKDTDGKNYYTKGYVGGVYYIFTKEEFYDADYCKDNKSVVEYYCIQEGINSYKKSIEHECDLGCSNGACI